jgi:hypothetical protein
MAEHTQFRNQAHAAPVCSAALSGFIACAEIMIYCDMQMEKSARIAPGPELSKDFYLIFSKFRLQSTSISKKSTKKSAPCSPGSLVAHITKGI